MSLLNVWVNLGDTNNLKTGKTKSVKYRHFGNLNPIAVFNFLRDCWLRPQSRLQVRYSGLCRRVITQKSAVLLCSLYSFSEILFIWFSFYSVCRISFCFLLYFYCSFFPLILLTLSFLFFHFILLLLLLLSVYFLFHGFRLPPPPPPSPLSQLITPLIAVSYTPVRCWSWSIMCR